MACNYAKDLSQFADKGICGIPEIFEEEDTIQVKVSQLAELIKEFKSVVVHTGAGISTSAGIPDFRGPKGVWTLESRGETPTINIGFHEAQPTYTHMALAALVQQKLVTCIVSQNIDGLHLRTGLKAPHLYELHGNMFLDACDKCHRLYTRNSVASTVGQKYTGSKCLRNEYNGRRQCRGQLRDTILDWEAELPIEDLEQATAHSKVAELNLCLGSSLQIIPSGTLPLLGKKRNGKLVICNLQPTKYDDQADLVIHTFVDDIFKMLTKKLGIEVPDYDPNLDPTKSPEPLQLYRIPSSFPKPRQIKREAIDRDYTPVSSRKSKNIKKKINKNKLKNEKKKFKDEIKEEIDDVLKEEVYDENVLIKTDV